MVIWQHSGGSLSCRSWYWLHWSQWARFRTEVGRSIEDRQTQVVREMLAGTVIGPCRIRSQPALSPKHKPGASLYVGSKGHGSADKSPTALGSVSSVQQRR